jgi:PAS domain S-box-containing protein
MKPKRILVVEDEAIVALDVKERLTDMGYEVCGTVERGDQALELAASSRPDLVLMDIRLKGEMDGIAAAEEIRQRWRIPVIYLTAFSEDQTLQRAKFTEPFGYIIKPFEDREIQSTIEMALYKHQAEQRLRESERRYATTLTSIGDGVIATDAGGAVTFMNPVAERLTGWSLTEAQGRPLSEVFRIANEQTRQIVEDPVARVLREGTTVGLANHTLLISRDGREIPIDDCASPIRDDRRTLTGTVLVFQDVSERRRKEAELRRIEWMLSPKAPLQEEAGVGGPQAYGDLAALNTSRLILDGVGPELLRGIVGDYLDMLETSSAVYERNGDYAFGLFSSGWCRFMDQAARKCCRTPDNREALASGRWHCHESCWTEASQQSMERGEPVDIACRGGIRLYAVPISTGAEIVGSINFGYGDPPRDPAVLRELAERYSVGFDELQSLAGTYQTRPPFIIELAKRRLESSARLIGEIVRRRQTEEALGESEERYRALFDRSLDCVFISDFEGSFMDANQAALDLLGYRRQDIPTLNFASLLPEDQFSSAFQVIEEVKSSGFQKNLSEYRLRRKDAEFVFVETQAALLYRKGKPIAIQGIARDITERKRNEQEREQTLALLEAAIAQSPSGILIADAPDVTIRWTNPAALGIRGQADVPLTGIEVSRHAPHWQTFQPDGTVYSSEDLPLSRAVLKGETTRDEEVIIRNAQGEDRWVSVNAAPIRNREGVITSGIVIFHDITDRKRAEEEQEKLQAQLVQAQKMESVGRLAGGVAHDFNNMLSAILGHAELAMIKCPPSEPLLDDLKAIQKAGLHSADLVRQLLAFARKQTVALRVLDLNDTVSGMLKMLRRLIGEDIDLVWMPGAALWSVKLDPSQVDQLLANLCVNSRDAIAGVGKITIETKNTVFDGDYCAVHPGFACGQYVLLAVSDDGCGMSPEVLEHLFEPFFTTKDVGQGTGLGLAMVYGIVKQNEGFINVYSEPGKGTTFKIYLPRHIGEAVLPAAESRAETPKGRGETLLLVEDEPAVLELGRGMLETLGYRVLTAATPGEALRQAKARATEIRLLISDVVMPEMNGRELAQSIGDIKPGLKCLFLSGYTANVIAHHGVLEEGVAFLQKPFSMKDLAFKVRQALDG